MPAEEAGNLVMCRKSKAFTLIELLVVIAIIALLMSILMPAMAKVNKMARSVVCLSKVRHWCVIWEQYIQDNDGFFTEGPWWVNPLREYYKEPDIRVCPMATKPEYDANGRRTTARHPYASWGIHNGTIWKGAGEYENDYGSYGMNGWLCNPPPPKPDEEPDGMDSGGGRLNELLWRTSIVKGAAKVPMFLDSSTYENMTPNDTDEPPLYDGQEITGNVDEMRICCINRHDGIVNVAFVDFSARKIGLKQLWRQKWHRSFDVFAPPPNWSEDAPWMVKLPDYE